MAKRQVKSPKVYIRDTGVLHSLLGIGSARDLHRHPKVGASWEGFMLHQVLEWLGAAPEECFFWATHSGAEIDCLWIRGQRRWGFEFKRTSSPTLTRSVRTALDLLGLQRVYIIHAGAESFPLHAKVTAVAASQILEDLKGRA